MRYRAVIAALVCAALAACSSTPPAAPSHRSLDEAAAVAQVGLGFEAIRRNARDAIRDHFDPVIASFEAAHPPGGTRVYCSRDLKETLLYTAMAAAEKQDAVVVGYVWAQAYYLKGYAHLDLGQVAEAHRWVERALALSPANATYLAERAYLLQAENRPQEALDAYVAAEEAARNWSPEEIRDTELGRALRGQGFSLIELGRLDDAEAVFRRCLEIDPDDKGARNELLYIEQRRKGVD